MEQSAVRKGFARPSSAKGAKQMKTDEVIKQGRLSASRRAYVPAEVAC